MSFRKSPIAFAFLVVFATESISHAAIVAFNGQTSSDWGDATNWTPFPPGTADFAEIFGTTAEVSNGNAESSYIDVRQQGVLNVTGGDLTFGFANNRWMWVGWRDTGTVNQTGGVISTVGNNVDVIIDNYGIYNMSGGELNISDDLRMYGNAVFNLSGDATVNIDDELRIANGSSVEFNIELTGNVPPVINVTDVVVLRGNTTLNIDSSNWTGDDDVALFTIDDRIIGAFDSVTLNGVEVPPTQYEFVSGSLVFSVPEPRYFPATLGAAVMILSVSRRRSR